MTAYSSRPQFAPRGSRINWNSDFNGIELLEMVAARDRRRRLHRGALFRDCSLTNRGKGGTGAVRCLTAIVDMVRCKKPEDVTRAYPTASILEVNRRTFHGTGNDSRLMTIVPHAQGLLMIRLLESQHARPPPRSKVSKLRVGLDCRSPTDAPFGTRAPVESSPSHELRHLLSAIGPEKIRHNWRQLPWSHRYGCTSILVKVSDFP